MRSSGLSRRLPTIPCLVVWGFVPALVCLHAASARAQTPVITSFAPESGPPGTLVVIQGSAFYPPLTVTFGGGVNAGGEFQDDVIDVTVPEGAQTGPITVFRQSGSASTAKPFIVTAPPPPTPTPTPIPVPVITSATTASGQMDDPFTYQIQADHSVSSYDAGTLPTGLSVDTASGLISGTPEESGTYEINITATDANGTGSATLVLTIAGDIPVLNVTAAPTRIRAADGQSCTIIFTLSRPVPRVTYVNFNIYGAVGTSVRYFALSKNSVKIRAGKTSATITLTPNPTPAVAPPPGSIQKVKLRVFDNDYGALGGYTAGPHSNVAIKIVEP